MTSNVDYLRKELQIFKKYYKPIREMPLELKEKLYLIVKDISLLELLEERYRFGFDSMIDLSTLGYQQVDLSDEIKEDERQEIIIETSKFEFTYDPDLLNFTTLHAIKAYAIREKKNRVAFEDIPYI